MHAHTRLRMLQRKEASVLAFSSAQLFSKLHGIIARTSEPFGNRSCWNVFAMTSNLHVDIDDDFSSVPMATRAISPDP